MSMYVKNATIAPGLPYKLFKKIITTRLEKKLDDNQPREHLHKESEKIRIKRGVREGNTISPKLFAATLEGILFRRLHWENKGVAIDV